jgi:hypothetical protein
MAIRMGICPKCENRITSARAEAIDIKDGMTTKWKGVSFSCPSCHVVLSVELDPFAMKSDLVSGVVKALRGR